MNKAGDQHQRDGIRCAPETPAARKELCYGDEGIALPPAPKRHIARLAVGLLVGAAMLVATPAAARRRQQRVDTAARLTGPAVGAGGCRGPGGNLYAIGGVAGRAGLDR